MAKKAKITTPTTAPANDPYPSRDIVLAGRVFSVPPLVIAINRYVYPLCVRLTRSGLLDGMDAAGHIDLTGDDIDTLADVAFWGACAADPTMDRAVFDELPITPGELINAFIIIRVQTGGWVIVQHAA